MQIYEDNNMDPPMPKILAGGHLLDALIELGWADNGGMSPRPISWSELTAFSQACGPFDPKELQTIRKMSSAYLQGLKIGEDPLGIWPFGEVE